MVGESFDLLGHPVPGECLKRLDDPGMQRPPPLLEKASIGHFMCKGVLESVLAFGKEPRFIEKLSRLEVREAAVHGVFRQVGNGLQQRQGHLSANDRRSLQELFLLRWQPVNTRREHSLHRGRHLNA
jgi:hypothetical protein